MTSALPPADSQSRNSRLTAGEALSRRRSIFAHFLRFVYVSVIGWGDWKLCVSGPVSHGGCPSSSIAGVILLVDVPKWSEVNAVLMKSGYWFGFGVCLWTEEFWTSLEWRGNQDNQARHHHPDSLKKWRWKCLLRIITLKKEIGLLPKYIPLYVMEIWTQNWISPAVKSVFVVPLANRIISLYPTVGSHCCTRMQSFPLHELLCIYSIEPRAICYYRRLWMTERRQ